MVEVSDTIEPGSLEYGDRQVVADRMSQIQAQNGPAPPSVAPGPSSPALGNARDKLGQGPVSDKPVTAGLSVGPGGGPPQVIDPSMGPEAEKLRLIATNARNPYLRHLARNSLRALANRRA